MKKATLALVQVLGAAVCSAQYFHFNNVYFNNSDDTAYSFINVNVIDSLLYCAGVGLVDGTQTKSMLKLDMQGELIDIFDYPPPIVDYRATRNTALQIDESRYIYCPDRLNACMYLSQMPRMTCFTMQNEVIWEKDFAEWEDCDQELFINARKLLRISDTSFVFISLLRPYQLNPPSQFRFTEMNFDGEILNDYISTSSLWAYFSLTEVYKYGDNYILVGVDVNCGDYDINIIKTDLQGNVLSDSCIGNPNNCADGSAGTFMNEDGTLQMFYGRCIENFDTNQSTYEMRSMKINVSDWSIVYDYPIAFPEFDEGLLSGGARFTDFIKDPNGGYASVFYYYSPIASIHFQACALKLNSDGTLDWLNLYDPPNGYTYTTLEDIACTSDGGYVAAGSCGDFDPDYVERAWLLKIDACGYEEPNGCPPVVGVAEQQKLTMQVWPNPFHSQLKAILPQNANRMFITDAIGRVMFEEKVFYPNQQWNLSGLSDGVYVMSVELECGQVISQRVVKQ